MILRILTAACAALTIAPLTAQTERDLDAHEHGEATLDVVLEGDELLVDFASPWNNLVGFEHAPGNDEERTAVDAALNRLEDAAHVARPTPEAGCTLVEHTVEHTMTDRDDTDDHGHAESASDDHHDAAGDTHSEIRVGYVFRCDSPDALDGLEIVLGETWSGIEEVDVRLVGPGGQTATELDGGIGRLDLASVS